jgi:hypothetical protein
MRSPARPGRLRVARRYLTGFSALGIAAGLILTGAASGNAASPATSARIITLTSSTSSSAGHLVVRLKYEIEKGHAIKPLSLSYSGASSLKFKNAALVVAILPLGIPLHRQVRKAKGSPFGPIVRRISHLSGFGGTIPGRDLPVISWRTARAPHRLIHPGELIGVTLGSVIKTKKTISILVPADMQVGLLLGPSGL